LFFRQNEVRIHSGNQAQRVATSFALALRHVGDLAVAAVSADEFRRFVGLMSSPEELATSEANDSAVIADVDLPGPGLGAADEADR
jgi:hypothetical protein